MMHATQSDASSSPKASAISVNKLSKDYDKNNGGN